MPDIVTSTDIRDFMASANDAAARTELGLTALATTTPGTGIATALGINVGSAGAPILFNGAAGTPTSLVGTNITGLPLTTGVTGNLPVTNLNSGTSASNTTFWRGDGTWATPAGGSGSPAGGTSTVNALAAFVIDTSPGVLNTKTISANQTFTFSGAPAAGTWFSLLVHNTDFDFIKTITFPSSFSIVRQKVVTTTAAFPSLNTVNGDTLLTWFYDGTTYFLINDSANTLPATGQYTYCAGFNAGATATGADFSVFVGVSAGQSYPTSGQAVCVGYQSGQNAGDYACVYVGYTTGKNAAGASNVAVGNAAMASAGGAGLNIAIGVHCAEVITTMTGTIAVGYHTINSVVSCVGSVVIGDHAANSAFADIDNCIFIGPYSGVDRANTLWIEGQGTAIASHVPLIYGEFDNNKAQVAGTLLILPAASSSTVAGAGAALEVTSTTLAFRPPRMTKAQADAITGVTAGDRVTITDASANAATVGFGGAITGGGANAVPAFYNGSAWVGG